MTRIAVEGQATRTHPAERGTVHLHVTFSGTLRNDVVDQVARTHTILVDQAKAHVEAGVAERWESASVHSYVYDDRVRSSQSGGKQRVRRFRAHQVVQRRRAIVVARIDVRTYFNTHSRSGERQ